MNIQDYFINEKKLNELIEKYQELFDLVDYYANIFKEGVITTAEETDDAMKKLSGIYMSLNTVTGIAEAQLKKQEDKYFDNRWNEMEELGEKPVVARLEREASLHVAKYREIRNLFRDYTNNCDKTISVCQSSLKALEREKQLEQ